MTQALEETSCGSKRIHEFERPGSPECEFIVESTPSPKRSKLKCFDEQQQETEEHEHKRMRDAFKVSLQLLHMLLEESKFMAFIDTSVLDPWTDSMIDGKPLLFPCDYDKKLDLVVKDISNVGAREWATVQNPLTQSDL